MKGGGESNRGSKYLERGDNISNFEALVLKERDKRVGGIICLILQAIWLVRNEIFFEDKNIPTFRIFTQIESNINGIRVPSLQRNWVIENISIDKTKPWEFFGGEIYY